MKQNEHKTIAKKKIVNKTPKFAMWRRRLYPQALDQIHFVRKKFPKTFVKFE